MRNIVLIFLFVGTLSSCCTNKALHAYRWYKENPRQYHIDQWVFNLQSDEPNYWEILKRYREKWKKEKKKYGPCKCWRRRIID